MSNLKGFPTISVLTASAEGAVRIICLLRVIYSSSIGQPGLFLCPKVSPTGAPGFTLKSGKGYRLIPLHLSSRVLTIAVLVVILILLGVLLRIVNAFEGFLALSHADALVAAYVPILILLILGDVLQGIDGSI